MTTAPQTQPAKPAFARHQKYGGTYLVVADESAEFGIALEYVAKMAKANKCHVGVLYAMEHQGFQHWGNIEERIRKEQRENAEKTLWSVSLKLEALGGAYPSFYIEEGDTIDALARIIENDPNITMLVLGGGVHSSGPGPLVSYFTGKGMTRLRVPVMVVPGHLGFND